MQAILGGRGDHLDVFLATAAAVTSGDDSGDTCAGISTGMVLSDAVR